MRQGDGHRFLTKCSKVVASAQWPDKSARAETLHNPSSSLSRELWQTAEPRRHRKIPMPAFRISYDMLSSHPIANVQQSRQTALARSGSLGSEIGQDRTSRVLPGAAIKAREPTLTSIGAAFGRLLYFYRREGKLAGPGKWQGFLGSRIFRCQAVLFGHSRVGGEGRGARNQPGSWDMRGRERILYE